MATKSNAYRHGEDTAALYSNKSLHEQLERNPYRGDEAAEFANGLINRGNRIARQEQERARVQRYLEEQE